MFSENAVEGISTNSAACAGICRNGIRIYPATVENRDAPTADKYDISKKTPSILPAFAFKSQIAGAIKPKITSGTAKKISEPSNLLMVAIIPITGAGTNNPSNTPARIPNASCGNSPNFLPLCFSIIESPINIFVGSECPFINMKQGNSQQKTLYTRCFTLVKL